MNSFKHMNLPPKLLGALEAMTFHIPTPIQAKAIPEILFGKDLIGCAQTGTGKTAAFCIPLICHLLKNREQSALILVPTRELAFQILGVLKKMAVPFAELRTALLIGGASMNVQIQDLSRRPRIMVGTPGRVIDHLNRRTLSVRNAKFLVLDEADRMLDMGFAPQLREIFRYLSQPRQTLLFSATFPSDIEEMAKKYLNNPTYISVGIASQPVEEVKQSAIQTTSGTKNEALLNALRERSGSVLIFTRTKRRTDMVSQFLRERKLPADRIHGGLSQTQRNNAIREFRSNKNRILVATDIAARGLDILHIEHVINYDLPLVPKDYVHRIGRTARAGAQGEALSLLVPEDYPVWKKISQLYQIRGSAMDKPERVSYQGHRKQRRFRSQHF